MKKILIASTLFITYACYSQTFISFNTGATLPIGDFSSKDYTTTKSQYANTGFAVGITAGYMFGKVIGLSFSESYLFNPIDNANYVNSINQTFYLMGRGQQTINCSNIDLKKVSYNTFTSTIGLIVAIPLGEKNTIELIPSAGIALLGSTNSSLSEIDNINKRNYSFNYIVLSHTALIVNPKVIYKRKLSENLSIGIKCELDYVNQYDELIKVASNESAGGYTFKSTIPTTFNRSLATILTEVSVTYKF